MREKVDKIVDVILALFPSSFFKYVTLCLIMLKKVVAFSGGKDSMVMLDMLIKNCDNFSSEYVVIYNETDIEFPETKEFMSVVEDHYDIEITRIHPPKSFDELLIRWNGFWPSFFALWCQRELKILPSQRYYREKYPEGVILYTGSRRSEGVSRRDFAFETMNKKYGYLMRRPVLYMSEDDIWEYIKACELPVNPVYELGYKRCSCFFCPLRGKKDTVRLAHTHPDLWGKVCGWVNLYGPPPKQKWLADACSEVCGNPR